MDTKKAIQTLIKIAENQQKIINKLAQAQGLAPTDQGNQLGGATDNWEDVSAETAKILASLPSGKEATLQSAKYGKQSNMLDVVLNINTMNSSVVHDLRQALVGKTLRTQDGKEVQVPMDRNLVRVVGEA